VPVLCGQTPKDWRKSMYYRYYRSHFNTPAHFGVRTDKFKLIFFQGIDQWELYDLEKGPREMNNLYGDKEYAEITEELKREIQRLQTKLDDDPKNMG
jgi:hypothetical protein